MDRDKKRSEPQAGMGFWSLTREIRVTRALSIIASTYRIIYTTLHFFLCVIENVNYTACHSSNIPSINYPHQ